MAAMAGKLRLVSALCALVTAGVLVYLTYALIRAELF